MPTILKKAFLRTVAIGSAVAWWCQYFRVRPDDQAVRVEPLDVTNFNKILILIPHADDELVGCYKLIEQAHGKATGFYFGFLGDNTRAENAQARRAEMERSARALGLSLIISRNDPVNEISNLLRNDPWDLICVPNFIDWHHEHIEASHILLKALACVGIKSDRIKILTYQISVPLSENNMTHFSPMTRQEQKTKWNMFQRIYKTQYYIPVLRYILNERISGGLVKAFSAEVYSVYTYKMYTAALEKWRGIDKSHLRSAINNLLHVRETVGQICQDSLRTETIPGAGKGVHGI